MGFKVNRASIKRSVSVKTTPYNKTFQLKVPRRRFTYSMTIDFAEIEALAGKEIEISEYSIGANRYSEGDYIDLYFNELKIEDTWYTRETPEKSDIGNGGLVYTLPPDSVINLDFFNKSGINKTIWFKLKILYTP